VRQFISRRGQAGRLEGGGESLAGGLGGTPIARGQREPLGRSAARPLARPAGGANKFKFKPSALAVRAARGGLQISIKLMSS